MASLARHITRMTIDDAEHYTNEQRQAIVASYPDHERDARTKGLPQFGSGLVFPILDERLACEPCAIPAHWYRIIGLDFGYDHPFAAVSLAWDKDADTLYVTSEYVERQQTPIIHAAAVKPWGEWIPCAWPHDGLQHDKGSGEELAAQYRRQGLNVLSQHATHEEGGYGVEAGIVEMLDRMKTGRFKVFSTLAGWFAEKRGYHRKNGVIVKERDDLMSATRVALMMRRFAEAKRVRPTRASGRADQWKWD
jgi:hypothetical protein